MIRKSTLVLFFLSCWLYTNAQHIGRASKANIQLKASVVKNVIALRWAIDEPVAWRKSTKLSFTLKRFTILRNGQLLSKPEQVELGVFKVAEIDKWKVAVNNNNYAAIVAQALFGESFEVQMGRSHNQLEYIVNKSKEIEQRFAYALMAADLDFEVAKLAGWGFVDTTAKKGEKYLYRVVLNNEKKPDLQVTNGNATVAIDEAEELPSPQDFVGLFKDKNVLISWDYRLIKRFYTSFYVERSENGNDFIQLSDLPIVDMNSKKNKPSTQMLFVDSIPQNNKEYHYRIRGKTIFNEFGPYSKTIKGKGQKELKVGAQIIFSDIAKDETILIKWHVNEETVNDIKHFSLLHSETDEKDSYKVVKEYIDPTQRKLVTKSIAGSNYYKIRTIGKDAGFADSFAVLVQPYDETPPAIPNEVKGKIDSTGVAHISWKKNTEKDLKGYHVFRATKKGEEFVRLTDTVIVNSSYKDSIQLKSLSSEVYYRITAIDNRYNQSDYSKLLTLRKPDVLIPQSPVFTDYTQKDGVITLQFNRSFSKDVVKHQLYRIKTSEIATNNWKIIFDTDKVEDNYTYIDKDLQPNEQYRYYLKSIDKSGLVSLPSQKLTLTAIDVRPIEAIKKLKIKKEKKSIILSWQLTVNDIVEFLVYKATNNEKPTLWNTLSGTTTTVVDTATKKGETYTYLLKAILANDKPVKTEKNSIKY